MNYDCLHNLLHVYVQVYELYIIYPHQKIYEKVGKS